MKKVVIEVFRGDGSMNACLETLERVRAGMREAYPGDETYALKCECVVKSAEGGYGPCPKLLE